MEEVSFVDSDYKLWVLLDLTRNAIFRAREKELRKIGIRPMHASVLFIIDTIIGDATPTEISRICLKKPHTISSLIDRMERKGLVRKVKDLDKMNMVRVEITEEGRQALNQAKKREAIHNIMSVLSLDDYHQISLGLDKLMKRALSIIEMEVKLPYI